MENTRASKRRRVDPGPVLKARKGDEADVYDDIDGAHQAAKTPPASKRKAALDPLKNQKAQVSESPQKNASRGGSSLDFFKRFGRNQVSSPNGEEPPTVGSSSSRLDDEDDLEESSPDIKTAVDSAASTRKTPRTSKPQVNGKKTLEDHFKELAAEASREAERGGSPSASQRSRRTRDASTTSAPPSQSGKKQGKKPTGPAKDVFEVPESDDEPQTNGHSSPLKASPTKLKAKKPQRKANGTSKKHTIFDPTHLQIFRNAVIEKLTNKRPIALSGLHDEYSKVSGLINQTIAAGESNSMLIIGARGCGKTALVNRILREQEQQHSGDFLIVRLNGFIHTDDKIALREIWRQLGRDMELNEAESTTKNYADTLTTLLALLSHTTDQDGEQQSEQVTKSVIFILDEFEMFAQHPRQTLLYNLFDIAQSKKAPIAVLGLTTRVDVVDALEKRVKSRFSHRYVHLSLAKNLQAFHDLCRASMAVYTDELSPSEYDQLASTSSATQAPQPEGAITQWNALVDALLDTDQLQGLIKRLYYTTKSLPQFMAAQLIAVRTILNNRPLQEDDLVNSYLESMDGSLLEAPDSKLEILPSLGVLHLALLVCAARLTAIHDCETVSFALVYEEYKALASKAKLQASASGALAQGAATRVSSKGVARDAWAELMECGLIMNDGRGNGRVDVGLEELALAEGGLGPWRGWCKEI